jgi:hypothetical protein
MMGFSKHQPVKAQRHSFFDFSEKSKKAVTPLQCKVLRPFCFKGVL